MAAAGTSNKATIFFCGGLNGGNTIRVDESSPFFLPSHNLLRFLENSNFAAQSNDQPSP